MISINEMNTQQLIAELTEIEEDVRWGLINDAIERLIRLKHKLTKEDEQTNTKQKRCNQPEEQNQESRDTREEIPVSFYKSI
jgi:hypothetical protein